MSNNNKTMEDVFDEMLEAQCEQMAKERKEMEDSKNSKEVEETKEVTENILKRFLAYIKSIKFKNRCIVMSKKHKVSYKIVKNIFIKNILQKIADILHLTIVITTEIISGVVDFIHSLINKIVYFTKDVCIRIITLFTFNCGTYNVDDEESEEVEILEEC